MPLDLHGAEVVQIAVGGRAIALANISIIGCVGVASTADATTFPLNTPVLIAGSEDAKRDDLGTFAAGDTLHQADGILYEATNPVCVYVRHEEGIDPDDHAAKAAEAVDALLQARELTGYKPRILIAPGVSYETAVMTELKSTAGRLRAMVYAEAGVPFVSPPVPMRVGAGRRAERLSRRRRSHGGSGARYLCDGQRRVAGDVRRRFDPRDQAGLLGHLDRHDGAVPEPRR